MTTEVLCDGRVIGQTALAAGEVIITGPFITTASKMFGNWVTSSVSSQFVCSFALGAGTVSFGTSGGVSIADTINWMVLT